MVAFGSLDKSLKVWDVLHGSLMRVESANSHTDSLYGVHFTGQPGKILTASLDKTAKVWEVFDGLWKCTKTFDGPSNFLLGVRSSIDERWVIGGCKDRGVYFWDAHTGVAHMLLQGHKNSGESF
jgi:glucose repression regulatory protein TUP1